MKLFDKVPGVEEELAGRIVEELETAAHDGSLEEVEGFGSQRARAVRIALSGMLSESSRRRARRVMEGEGEMRRLHCMDERSLTAEILDNPSIKD